MSASRDKGLQVVAMTGAAQDESVVPEEEIAGVRYYRTSAAGVAKQAGLREWSLYRRLQRRLATVAAIEKPDIIHVHSPAYNGLAALRVAQHLTIPCIYEIRALWEDAAVDRKKMRAGSFAYRASSGLESYVCRHAQAVVTICDGLKREIMSRGIGSEKLFVAPNGVNPESFTPVTRDAELARAIGADGYPVIAFIGSLFNYEGVEDLLGIAPALIQRFPAVRILIVGGGERQAEVRSMVSGLGFSQIIYRPRVPHSEVQRYYSLADCMVYPRRRNRLTDTVTPLKPLEAMAMKKAVVASDVGGHQELVHHDVTGLLYQAEDSGALLAALERVASDTFLPQRLSEAARAYVLTERTWSRTADAEIEAYRYVLSGGVRAA